MDKFSLSLLDFVNISEAPALQGTEGDVPLHHFKFDWARRKHKVA